jgi:tetratricopeptide (TPR) repeat protein
MILRWVLIGGGLLFLGLLPQLVEAVGDSFSRRAIAHCLAGEELLLAGWLVPAEREFRRALRLQPLLGAAHFGLGKVRVRQERFPEAVIEFRAAAAALQQVDQRLGRGRADGRQAVPATLVGALADALDHAGEHGEAQRLRNGARGAPPTALAPAAQDRTV